MTSNFYCSVTLTPELRLRKAMKQALKKADINDPACVTKLSISGTLIKEAFEGCDAFIGVHQDNPVYASKNGKLIRKRD